MADLAINHLSLQRIYQSQSATINDTAAKNEHLVGQGEEAKSFATLAFQPGIIANLLNGQSVMIGNDGTKPVLNEYADSKIKFSADQSKQVVAMTTTALSTPDVDQLERIAASASSLIATQINTTAVNVKDQQAINDAAAYVGSVAAADVQKTKGSTPKLFSDMTLVHMSNDMATSAALADKLMNTMVANAGQRMASAAERAGNHNVGAAQARMAGAITSGAISLAGNGISTARNNKALKSESNSIKNNLGVANKLESNLHQNQNLIKQTNFDLMQKGKSVKSEVTNVMSRHDSKAMANVAQLRDNHSIIQNKTQTVRQQSEYGHQVTNLTQNMANSTFETEATQKNKQADMARADQSVNSEISNAQQQASKKASDTVNALNQVIDQIMQTNNRAVSTAASA
ncbi:hypothetical protein LU631_00970 [Erwinia tracheiphila]|uniref:Type III secretion system protein n=1 Tax=Erwinia tracheiphila TaxID=65700 RepID=A0A0M2KIA2_9GAMM|nr:hypothetical protein [Erwinia tracheiphila]EOS94408.1 hypothetical protein ETR_13771 [Erwinia tracheiphila PSU-1]KKF36746.1 hypothetical protein SY86_17040 [Erwinia tracheiphila]UIA88082.1 hypothetical protein LU631_00970 [Erwinia tracheiphila]UIA96675.1 hypothetical protein LU633_00970 [Erwinia tracheiphila]